MARPLKQDERLLLRLTLRRKKKLEAHALDVEKNMTQLIADYIDRLPQPSPRSLSAIEAKYQKRDKETKDTKSKKHKLDQAETEAA